MPEKLFLQDFLLKVFSKNFILLLPEADLWNIYTATPVPYHSNQWRFRAPWDTLGKVNREILPLLGLKKEKNVYFQKIEQKLFTYENFSFQSAGHHSDVLRPTNIIRKTAFWHLIASETGFDYSWTVVNNNRLIRNQIRHFLIFSVSSNLLLKSSCETFLNTTFQLIFIEWNKLRFKFKTGRKFEGWENFTDEKILLILTWALHMAT